MRVLAGPWRARSGPWRARILVALTAGLLGACAPGSQSSGPQTYTFRGPIMGTFFSVKVVAETLTEGRLGELQSLIDDELKYVDQTMSTYKADSELSRFNQHQATTPFALSSATVDLVALAADISSRTGGAYDITIGPLVNAWGFGAENQAPGLDDEQVAALRAKIGFDQLEINQEADTLRKRVPDLYTDLSSIAKGYAVDRVVAALETEGLNDIWVEVGGEVRVKGKNGEGRVWRLGIERPEAAPGTVQRILPLDGMAVATSGDYRNYRERDGVRYSHIIDPRTGWPIRHTLASVSVADTSCATADAWSTALLVLGPEEGWEVAVRENLAAFFISRGEDGFEERMTPAFEALSGS